MEQCGKI